MANQVLSLNGHKGSLPSRVVFHMQRLDAGTGYVGVDLRGGKITVPEQQLYHPEIGSVIQQMGRKCVTECVWR